MIICVDVDETIAKLHEVWLDRYNKKYDDDLQTDDVTDWEIHRFVKPECNFDIYRMLECDDMYDEVQPVPGALETVEWIRGRGHRVVFVSSTVRQTFDAKLDWLGRHGFTDKRKDFVAARDKSLVRGDFLIDDNYDNCKGFYCAGARGALLVTAPWNTHQAWEHRISSIAERGTLARWM